VLTHGIGGTRQTDGGGAVTRRDGCSPLGTKAFHLVEAARQLGFPASRKYTLASLDEWAAMLAEGHLPIVYVDLWPL
jgi:hypothetical protein